MKKALLFITIILSTTVNADSKSHEIQEFNFDKMIDLIVNKDKNPNYFFDESTSGRDGVDYYSYSFIDRSMGSFISDYPKHFISYKPAFKNKVLQSFKTTKVFLDCKNKKEISVVDDYDINLKHVGTTITAGNFISEARNKRCSLP